MSDMVSYWDMFHDDEPAPQQRRPPAHLTWNWYVDGVKQTEIDLAAAVQRAASGEGFVWAGLRNPDETMMQTMADLFALHDLAIEDVLNGYKRAKLERFGDVLFVVVSSVDFVAHDQLDVAEIVETGQIMVFLGQHFVITSRTGGRPFIGQVRRNAEASPETLALGPWQVLYQILDKVVDSYTDVVTAVEEDVEQVEESVFSMTGTPEIDRPYALKRELIQFKRSVNPLTTPLNSLASKDLPHIPSEARDYFRDLVDHHVVAREAIASMDEVLTTILQTAVARVGLADNRDMRKVSSAVALLAIPTTVAAIYGMNFDNMPELRMEYGYYMVIGFCVITMLVAFLAFRHNKWM